MASSYLEALLGEEPEGLAVQPHRLLLFGLVAGALRAEAGVEMRKAENKRSDYYAGRRAGFVASAAQLMATLYGGDYESAKHSLAEGIRTARHAVPVEDLLDPDTQAALARTIAENALRVI